MRSRVLNLGPEGFDVPPSDPSRRERQGGIVPLPCGRGLWVGARVVAPRRPILLSGHHSSERRRTARAMPCRDPTPAGSPHGLSASFRERCQRSIVPLLCGSEGDVLT
jgi:hypothetical protein